MTLIRRSEIDALVADPNVHSIEAVGAAISQLDHARALRLLFARAKSGASLPIEMIAELVPRLDNTSDALMLIAAAEGPRTEALVSLLDRDAFPHDAIGRELLAITIFMAWRLHGELDVRAPLAEHARLAVYDRLRAGESTELIAAIATELDDEVLTSLILRAPQVSTFLAITLVMATTALQMSREGLLRYLENLDPDLPLARVATAVALDGARVGRNEPCPCGSGRKFKRCHGDLDAMPLSVGPSTAPRANTPVQLPRTIESVQTIALHELAKIAPHRLSPPVLHAAMDRFAKYRAWSSAERVLEELVTREEVHRVSRQSLRIQLAFEALMCSEYAVAAKWLRELPDDFSASTKPAALAAVAIATRASDALDRLLAVLDLVVRDDTGAVGMSLASVIGKISPVLAILLVRACATADAHLGTERMLPQVERARVRLGLAPEGDPAAALFDAVSRARLHDAERTRTAAATKVEVEGLRTALADTRQTLRDRERQIADLVERLHQARTEVVPALPAPDAAEVRALKAKIDDLQAMIRERNEELSSLRRRPESTGGSVASAPKSSEVDEREDDWEPDGPRDRRVVVPVWPKAPFVDVPVHVAREALRTAAELATGEALAWRDVKRAKGTRAAVLMSRIGIHHRLLFRIAEERLDVLELVPREGLLLSLKRY